MSRSRPKLPDPDAVVADATLLDVLRELAPEERPRWNDWAVSDALTLSDDSPTNQSADNVDHAGDERD